MLTKKLIRLLSFVFFFSGFSALIYQVTWQRLLTLHYGVGSISTTLIVSIYMAGLGFGSFAGGWLAEKSKNKFFLFFLIQLFIGCFAVLSLPFLNLLGQWTAGSNYTTSFGSMSLFLMIPTLLMGMTFPILTKIFNVSVKNFQMTVSHLYFINTIGAACGTILGSYVLISFLGLDSAIYIASVINIILAFIIYNIRNLSSEDISSSKVESETKGDLGRVAFLLVFIAGCVGMGYEIIWFRVIGVLIKDSPYAFPSILSVILLGISLGSHCVNKRLSRGKFIDSKNIYFSLQFLIGFSVLAIFIGYYYLTAHTPFSQFTIQSARFEPHPSPLAFRVMGSATSLSEILKGIYSLIDVFFWPFVFVFVPSLLMGASFPLISKLALIDPKEEGRTVGNVYFYNILGNVAGVILTGFVLLPHLGTAKTILLFTSIGLIFGVFVTTIAGKTLKTVYKISFVGSLVLLSIIIFPKGGEIYRGMHMPYENRPDGYYYEEGIEGVVITVTHKDFLRNFINGVEHGGRPGSAFYVQAIDALSRVPEVKDVLIIGYGTGSTLETVLKINRVENITIVELNKTLIKNLTKIKLFQDMLSDERINFIFDDGRRFLIRSQKKYDLILIDPLKTTAAYSNNVFSKQFFELVKQDLKPNGVFSLWTDEFAVVPKTVAAVFDYVYLFAWKQAAYCLASHSPMKRDQKLLKFVTAQFPKKEQTAIMNSTPKFMGTQNDIYRLLMRYPINEDWKPVSEYYIGLRTLRKFYKNIP